MPVNPSLCHDNWKEIALTVKESAGWECSCCGKKCYEPGEKPEGLLRSQWTADILQVHHRNHDTSDNRSTNLMSVCASCHLGLHRSKYSLVSEGQLKLF